MTLSLPSPSYSLYDRLAEGARSWIDAHGWVDFSEIQSMAMPALLDGRGGLLVAPTASGKTEAALLPILTRVIEQRTLPIAILYVAPLRALINDQARRIAKIVEECSLSSAWWHGDLPHNERLRIVRRPPHALLTTPESIEVLLSSDSYGHGALLGNVRFVLIDEIHAFADGDRGAQLVSLLQRLEIGQKAPPVRIALSATVGEPQIVANWIRSANLDAPPIDVFCEQGTKGRRLGVGLIPELRDETLTKAARKLISGERLADVLAKQALGVRLIIFVPSRAKAEELTVGLRERNIDALIHHGSLDVTQRRATEDRFRQDGPKAIVATSTLELGIDIGDLELVIQVGNPGTVSSLLQRVGRSGRRIGTSSVGMLYATSDTELPMMLAAGELAMEGVVEPVIPPAAAIHIAFHQAINLVRERDAIGRGELIGVLRQAGAFQSITDVEWAELLDEIIEMDLLEDERGRLRVGLAAERSIGFANYRDFYSVFETDAGWTVKHGENTIGSLDLHFPVSEGRASYFVLAGRRWKVDAVDRARLVLQVSQASVGPVPHWTSSGVETSYEIMQRACELLAGRKGKLETIPLEGKMRKARAEAASLGVSPGHFVITCDADGFTHVLTYLGSRTNEYLARLLGVALSAGVSASGEGITIGKDASQMLSEIAAIIREIIVRAEYRAELEAEVLISESLPPVGKYWHLFGPRTRRNVVRRFLFGDRRHGERIANAKVAVAGSEGSITQ